MLSKMYLSLVSQPPTPTPIDTPAPTETPSPTPTATPTETPTPTPTPRVLEWDARLDQRGALLIHATVEPEQGYWRLVQGAWYAENEPPFAGQHHIFVDALATQGDRQTGVRLAVTSLDGTDLYGRLITESKPGEPYAANFPMYVVAPAYRVAPSDGNPADAVTGLGLGSIELPKWTVHTSYGFVWQWTVAPAATPTPEESYE